MQNKSLLWTILRFFVNDPGVISSGLIRFGKVALLGAIGSLMIAPFWSEGMTPIGITLVIAGLAALEKLVKEFFGVGV